MKNNNRGTAIIEFVIVMPLFFLMLFGMLYGGIMLHDYSGLNELTRAAARAGAIEQTDDSEAENPEAEESSTKKVARVKKFITDNGNNYLLLYSVVENTIVVKDDEKINEEDAIVVSVSANRTDDIPLIVNDLLPETISSSMSMRIEK